MEKRRLELHERLCEILGSRNVYFQPPSNKRMEYPCIIYKRSGLNTIKADNMSYNTKVQYTVTIIDYDPDNIIGNRVAQMLHCGYDRHYVKDNLNHDVYRLYY